ncbi:MAG: 1-aminocyclopropane-1-carboxylate deaminase/D-cysteine desulfhydrase [Lentihominibacter sp.]
MLAGYDKISFLNLPTPLDYLPRLSKELGVEFYLKRDDLTGIGAGGNKLRKLEYLLKDALDKNADRLLTVGGVQTNHGRLTAAVAARYGLKCTIACIGSDPGELSANLLLDRIMGSEVVIRKSDGSDEDEQLGRLVRELVSQYEAEGERVYYIPLGGSNETGMLGYYECALELMQQASDAGIDDARLFSAVGSFGTYMGLYCGLNNEGSSLRYTGIAIMPFDEKDMEHLHEYFNKVKTDMKLDIDAGKSPFDIELGYTRGGYNNPSREVRDAIYLMARNEGIILDPCYTGKCFAGIVEMIREGRIKQGEKVIMLHTGGMPGIYTKHHRVEFERELRDGVRII